jgi:ketosteroid isomerase-like protein
LYQDDFFNIFPLNSSGCSEEEFVKDLKFLLIITLSSLFACLQKINSNDSLGSLVEAERSFAKASMEKGIKETFLTYLADDAIVFRPKPIMAKPLYAQRPHIPGSLSWKPIFADISASGDFGYTTGPYEYRSQPEKEQADGYGFYVSVWKKQTDGAWRVSFDGGIDCPLSDTTTDEIDLKQQRQKISVKTISQVAVEREKGKLLETDMEFSSRVASEGMVNAYQDYSAYDIRYYRNGEQPVVGKKNVCDKIRQQPGTMIWKPMASDVAKSGELGYTCGISKFETLSGDKKSNSYLRIWKKSKEGNWKVVLDLANPIPEESNNKDE